MSSTQRPSSSEGADGPPLGMEGRPLVTETEIRERIREAMKPFLFKKVTPNLIDLVEKALGPVVEQALLESATMPES